jgi:hypothetical protein
MHSIKFLYPKSSFSRLISKNLENLPLDLNLVYRFNQKVNGVSMMYSHKKDGYFFNNTFKEFQCSTKILIAYKNDNLVINEKIKILSYFPKLTNDYSIKISNLTSGELIVCDDFMYEYNLNTNLKSIDLFRDQSSTTKDLLNYIQSKIKH